MNCQGKVYQVDGTVSEKFLNGDYLGVFEEMREGQYLVRRLEWSGQRGMRQEMRWEGSIGWSMQGFVGYCEILVLILRWGVLEGLEQNSDRI